MTGRVLLSQNTSIEYIHSSLMFYLFSASGKFRLRAETHRKV